MSDLLGNHIVGFPTRWLIYFDASYVFSDEQLAVVDSLIDTMDLSAASQ